MKRECSIGGSHAFDREQFCCDAGPAHGVGNYKKYD
jgi:hypothetical protein